MSGGDSLQKKLQGELEKYQAAQKELQKFLSARQQLDAQLNENNMVKEELSRLDAGEDVYKLIGPVLVKQELPEAQANVGKRIDYISTEVKRHDGKIKDLEKKQDSHRENLTKLQHQFQQAQGKTAPMEVYVDDDSKLTLHGLRQHYVKLKDNEKNRKLFELLDILEFNQVIIFVKSVQRCMALAQLLVDQNFPAIAIHRAMTQDERLSRYQQFKDFQKRILVATNLFGRGMDIERVNIVFNYDMPEDSDTYLHRVARAGRFGTRGLAITFVSDENDAKVLNDVQDRFEVNITELPDEIDIGSYIEGR